MVNKRPTGVDRLFGALADPVRLAIVDQLARHGPRRVGELELPKRLSGPAVAKHLRVLESAGLLSQQIQGRTRLCRLNRDPLGRAAGWLGSLTAAAVAGAPSDKTRPRPSASSNRAVLERLFGLSGEVKGR
jgi:DNA-binding transcriptional ArsR family regulator